MTKSAKGLRPLTALCGLLLISLGAVAVKSAGGPRTNVPEPVAPSVRYTITDFGSLSPHAINNHGEVVAVDTHNRVVGGEVLWDLGKVTRLGRLVSYCRATAMNDSGQIVGISGSGRYSGMIEDDVHAFLWQGSTMTDLGTPTRSSQVHALGINNAGQIVGSEDWHPVLWTDGRKIRLPTLVHDPPHSTVCCEAQAVNNLGLIVGYAGDSQGWEHAVIWQNEHIHELATLPNILVCAALAVNDVGQVVGRSFTRGNRADHGCLWDSGKMRDLGTLPGAADSEAYAINNGGVIVGGSGGQAVIWRGGRIADLNRLIRKGSGWHLLDARAINNRGQIVGMGLYHGRQRGFRLTPMAIN